MVLIALARQPQRRQNCRHRSSNAPSRVVRSRTSSRFAAAHGGASPTFSDSNHLCRNRLVLLFLDLVLLIQSDLFGILGFFFLSLLFLHRSLPFYTCLSSLSSVTIPKTVREALAHLGWHQTMTDKLSVLHNSET